MAQEKTATAPKKREFKKVESTFADPWVPENKGDQLEGLYVGTEEAPGKKRGELFRVWKIKDANGKAWSISGAQLKSIMKQIPRNTYVQVTYLGTEETRDGNKMKLFDVAAEAGTQLRDPYEEEEEEQPVWDDEDRRPRR